MLTKVKSLAFYGLDPTEVDVEINVNNRGMPGFDIVGLPNKSVAESIHRVKSAIQNSGYMFPNKKITVNLAPADIHKEGSFYDLAIAVGIMAAILDIDISSGQLFFGELSLDGTLRQTKGALNAGLFALQRGYKGIFLSDQTTDSIKLCIGLPIYKFSTLKDLLAHLTGSNTVTPFINNSSHLNVTDLSISNSINFDDIVGQDKAKKMAAVMVAGGHHMLALGSPGIGKTMLANSLSNILPPLDIHESIEVTKIYSYAGISPGNKPIITVPPIRSPHHSTTYVGMIGGGSSPKPGEISLAHLGVLFLDEFCEFSRQVIEVLRQPLELGYIALSRSRYSLNFPARFTLFAAANPCKCGYRGDAKRICTCTPHEIKTYINKISGPFLDRIDLITRMRNVPEFLLDKDNLNMSVSTSVLKQKVKVAREIQRMRYSKMEAVLNRDLTFKMLETYAPLSNNLKLLLQKASTAYNLSKRSCISIIKVARTLADMEGDATIKESHILEAIQYKCDTII